MLIVFQFFAWQNWKAQSKFHSQKYFIWEHLFHIMTVCSPLAWFEISLVGSSETSKDDSQTSGIPVGLVRRTTVYFWFSHNIYICCIGLYISDKWMVHSDKWFLQSTCLMNKCIQFEILKPAGPELNIWIIEKSLMKIKCYHEWYILLQSLVAFYLNNTFFYDPKFLIFLQNFSLVFLLRMSSICFISGWQVSHHGVFLWWGSILSQRGRFGEERRSATEALPSTEWAAEYGERVTKVL